FFIAGMGFSAMIGVLATSATFSNLNAFSLMSKLMSYSMLSLSRASLKVILGSPMPSNLTRWASFCGKGIGGVGVGAAEIKAPTPTRTQAAKNTRRMVHTPCCWARRGRSGLVNRSSLRPEMQDEVIQGRGEIHNRPVMGAVEPDDLLLARRFPQRLGHFRRHD